MMAIWAAGSRSGRPMWLSSTATNSTLPKSGSASLRNSASVVSAASIVRALQLPDIVGQRLLQPFQHRFEAAFRRRFGRHGRLHGRLHVDDLQHQVELLPDLARPTDDHVLGREKLADLQGRRVVDKTAQRHLMFVGHPLDLVAIDQRRLAAGLRASC